MKKTAFILFITLLTFNLGRAQNLVGYNSGNYAGISGVYLNPASIADNRFKADFILTGMDLTFANNYVGVKTKDVLNGKMFKFKGDFKNEYLIEYANPTVSKSFYLEANYQFPSFMVAITPKTTLAFIGRTRFVTNLDNVNYQLAKLSYESLKWKEYWKINLNNDEFAFNSMAWAEYGIGIGQVAIDKGQHFLKAGAFVKILLGVEAAYLYAKQLNYNWANDSILTLFSTKFGYGHSDNFEFNKAATDPLNFIHYNTKPSVGGDFGVVYEWRPDYKKYLYDLDGKTNQQRADKDKYRLRLGASLIDLGRITFKKGDYSHDFDAQINNWNVKRFNLGSNPVQALDDTIRRHFKENDPTTTFNMVLPTTFSVQVDYNIWKGFYANFVSFTSPRFFTDEHRLHALNYYALTPRWESKWLGVYMPFSFNQYGDAQQGLALRLGPLVVGSNDLGPYIWRNSTKGIDFHFGLKVPIPFGKPPRDKDGDKVSDRLDKCPDVKGSWEYRGCPDSDNDGIPDGDDECPKVAGLKQFKGCPDSDNDGIPDKDDNCPNDWGLKKFKGCPDKDGDDIMDKEDSCVNEKGLAKFHGCPDTDGDEVPDKDDNCPEDKGPIASNGCPDKDADGVIDINDKCPEVKGSPEHNGCPDTDGDGVYDGDDNCINEAGPKENKGCPWSDLDKDGTPDRDDRCPDTKGPKENKGCPWGDIDGDGVKDNVDKCPETPGPKENNGCPVVKVEEKQAIDSAIANLQYENGKSLILTESFKYLDRLAEVMLKHPTWTLKISGHTDNMGADDFNLDLSRRRSEAVKQYFVSKGVAADKLIAEYFGKTKPVASNDTPEGRAKNRRVEMKIIFK